MSRGRDLLRRNAGSCIAGGRHRRCGFSFFVALLSLLLARHANAWIVGGAPCSQRMAGSTALSCTGRLRLQAPLARTRAPPRQQQWHNAAAASKATVLRMDAMPRDEAADRYSRALVNTALSLGAAGAFGLGLDYFLGQEAALQYFAGYVVEQSLSVDNLFVFLLLFEYFQVPVAYQSRVLSYGIFGAVAMRGLFIAVGEAAITLFQPVLLGFAALLLYSSFKLLSKGDEDESDLTDNTIVKLSRKFLDATDSYDGDRFFTLVDGVKRATPLLVVLLCVELSDIVFAVDSIPAVFGVTRDPLIVYTSNIFAILNLRSLFTVLSNAVGDLPYLQPAVAIVLGFVGAKLGAEYFGVEVSTVASLAVIGTLLGGGVGLSLYEKNAAEAAAAAED